MSWILVKGVDSQLYREIGSSLILFAGSVVGSYVFGAVWDATDMRRTGIPDIAPPPDMPVQPVQGEGDPS